MYNCLLVNGAPTLPLIVSPSGGSVTMGGGAVRGVGCVGGDIVSCSCVGVLGVVTTTGLLVRCGVGDDVEMVGVVMVVGCVRVRLMERGIAGTLS